MIKTTKYYTHVPTNFRSSVIQSLMKYYTLEKFMYMVILIVYIHHIHIVAAL